MSKLQSIKENLKDVFEYKFDSNLRNHIESSPFICVYKLLDEIGRKIDWPPINDTLNIEEKLSYLLAVKQKADKGISISSLNKQISFYGLALFFNKLIELNTIAKKFFSDMLVICRKFKLNVYSQYSSQSLIEESNYFTEPIDFAISNLIYCLKLWHKFIQHKEFSTIVTKCLSNSKLDSLICYKNFINDYYNFYSQALNITTSSQQTWASLSSLPLKQKIPLIVNLLISEKSNIQVHIRNILNF